MYLWRISWVFSGSISNVSCILSLFFRCLCSFWLAGPSVLVFVWGFLCESARQTKVFLGITYFLERIQWESCLLSLTFLNSDITKKIFIWRVSYLKSVPLFIWYDTFMLNTIVSPLLLIINFKSLLYGQEDFYPLSPIHHLRIMMQAGKKKKKDEEKTTVW